MAPMTDCFDSDGVRYRYLHCKAQGSTGRRRPPAILVHGFAQSSSSWIGAMDLIAQERDVYAIDLVGHGGSAVPASPAPYSLRSMGEALLDFIDLVPGKPVVVGYSMGGRVALSAAWARKRKATALPLPSATRLPCAACARRACATS